MSAPEPAAGPLGSSTPDYASTSVSVDLSGLQPHPVVAAVRDADTDEAKAAAVLDWAARELWNDDYPEATGCLDAIVDGLLPPVPIPGGDEWHIQMTHAGLHGSKDCHACQVARGEQPSLAERIRAADLPVVPDGVPSTSDEDVYLGPARAHQRNVPKTAPNWDESMRWLASHKPFRAAVDEARRAEREHVAAVGEQLGRELHAKFDAALAEARATIAELRAELAKWAEGEMSTEYGYVETPDRVGWVDWIQPRDVCNVKRRIWLGPVVPVDEEEATG